MDKNLRMEELVRLLNAARAAYYTDSAEIMSNYEYDKLEAELLELERETGVVLPNSPTQAVGAEVVESLEKIAHEKRMLSLDKTKTVERLIEFLGESEGLLSWKLDGLTIVLTYENGILKTAVTRGNGEIGEIITHNAREFKNIPKKITHVGTLVIRGEAVIPYSEFNRINEANPDTDTRYKNPRNLCAGTVRQLSNAAVRERNVKFFAFGLVRAEGMDFGDSKEKQLKWLKELGFECVDYIRVDKNTVAEAVEDFRVRVSSNDLGSDGLVLTLDSLSQSASLGETSKFPRDSIAFKWQDEQAETRLLDVIWNTSRTGLINPIAEFEPVELEGTTVSRASLHNVSIVEGLQLGIGDTITVYKANMIIPQISDNLTRSDSVKPPEECPVCHGKTTLVDEAGVKTLYCKNAACAAQILGAITHFVGRDAMNIEGLSKESIKKLLEAGLIRDVADLYSLSTHRQAIVDMPGFNTISADKLLGAIEKSREVTLPALLYALGIPNIGLESAKLVCRNFDDDIERIQSAEIEDFSAINGFGQVMAESLFNFLHDETNAVLLNRLKAVLQIQKLAKPTNLPFAGKKFVITGKVTQFENRNALKSYIENLGGTVAGSVSKNTDFLINNDATSSSSKNKEAQALSVPIITEADLLDMVNLSEE